MIDRSIVVIDPGEGFSVDTSVSINTSVLVYSMNEGDTHRARKEFSLRLAAQGSCSAEAEVVQRLRASTMRCYHMRGALSRCDLDWYDKTTSACGVLVPPSSRCRHGERRCRSV